MKQYEIIAKLKALNNIFDRWLKEGDQMYDSKRVFDTFLQFNDISSRLRKEYPSLFSDLPHRDIPPLIEVLEYGGGQYIKRSELKMYLDDIIYCVDILGSLPTVDVPSMKITSEGVFFAGQYFDALRLFTEFLSKAQNNIALIDGYIDKNVLSLLTSKRPEVEVNILTKNVQPSLKTAGTAFKKQYGKLSIRTSQAFHDRFLIIDDLHFYHFGASIKDLGKRGFMFSRIEEPKIIEALRKEFVREWANATVEL